MKSLKKITILLFSMILVSAAMFAQDAEKQIIEISCDPGLKIVAIDGVDMKKKGSAKIEEGVHTLTMVYDKISILNESRTRSNGSFSDTYDFIPGYKYVLRMYIADDMSYRVIPRIVAETPFLNGFKSVRKPVEVQELPKKIDFIPDFPKDRKYEILGNLTFNAGYVPKVYKERNEDWAIYELGVKLQKTEADAVIYCYVRDLKQNKSHNIEGLAIKYIDELEEVSDSE